ncbi:hypothetical protein HW555_010367, partial [Spodoptera exigua]
LICLLKDKVDLFNVELLRSSTKEYRNKKYYCQKLFNVYVDILYCCAICNNVFKTAILFQAVDMLYHNLVGIQILINVCAWLKYNSLPGIAYAVILYAIIWIVKSLTLQITLTLQCEKFYIATEQVNDSCGIILNTRCSVNEKILCKNIKRHHKASFEKINACRLFNVDASLSFSLISTFTNYTFVLLQFAFL